MLCNRLRLWPGLVACLALVLWSCGSEAPTSGGQGTSPRDERRFSLPNGVEIEMVWIGPGTFQMGSPDSEEDRGWFEGPVHEVKISRGFYLGKYEVTQEQWEAVMETTPWSGESDVQEDPSHPAVYISWNHWQEFIGRLNAAAGEALYRLPTEAEWEYACRAGTQTRWSFGDDANQLPRYAWYDDNACDVGECYAHTVGTKRPNPWGLYDMHGNVYERVQDWFDPRYYGLLTRVDPPGPTIISRSDPSGVQEYHVTRGGSFRRSASSSRSAERGSYAWADVYHLPDVGVRLLRIR